MGSPYPGYGNYGSLVPSGPFGQIGQVLGGLGASAGQWLPLIGQMMQGQEETAWKGLQIALQSPDANVRRQAIEDYEKRRKSPFHVPWPKVTVPGQVTTPAQPAVPAVPGVPPAPPDINVPEGGLAAPTGGQAAVPAVPEVRAPSTQQYWVPPVAFGDRTVGDVLAGNPALASLPDAIKNARWADLPPEMQAELGKYFTAPFVWGGLVGSTAPTPGPPAPVTPPASSPGAAPAPGQPSGPPAGAVPARPQPPVQPGVPGQPSAARVNPAIVEGARGKNIGQLSAAEVLESRGVPLTPQEETELSAIPITNFANPLQLEDYLNKRRVQEAQIASETATAGLRGAETGRIEQETAAARVKSKQDFYRGKAFGILFDNLPDAAARIAQMRQQIIDEKVPGLEPESVMGQAREMVNTARTGQAIPVPLKGPDGKPISVYMTGAEYRRMQQEDERLALTRGAERVNQIKRQILEPIIKQYGYDTSKWPDDARVLIGIEPKPTSPLAILQMATRLAQSDLRFTAAPDQASRNAIIHEYIDTIRAGLEEVKPTKPGPGPTTPGAAGAKPPSGPLDPKVAALVKALKGPQAPALQAAGALGTWLQRTFAEIPPVGTPEDAVILMQLERAWPGLTPAQRTQLATALPIQPAMVAWLDRHVQTPGGPPGPGAPPAASPGVRGPQPGQPTKPGVGRQLTMAAVRQQAAEKGISVAAALAQAKEDGYVIKP